MGSSPLVVLSAVPILREPLNWEHEVKKFIKSISLAALTFVFAEAALAQQVMSNEPPPGQLGAGQVVFVACGPGKARKVTGGSNIAAGAAGNSVSTGKGSNRTRGPCVPMK
jgi:hypothetical protein